MGDNTGKPYEKLAQVVFQLIINQDDVRNVVVQHDVTLQGKHNPHQIDVYWKFAMGHLEYETVVEAKDWKEPVDQGELFKFQAVLEDLPGQPKGIFVSRTGYQKGARDYALAKGILIYELREAPPDRPLSLILTTTGWARLYIIRMPLRGIIAMDGDVIPQDMHALASVYDVVTPNFSHPVINPSSSWLKREYPTTDASELRKLNVPSSVLHEIKLYNQEGAVIGDLAAVFKKLAEAMAEEKIEQKRVTHVFEQPTFIRTDSSLIPRVKVAAVSVDVKIEHKQETQLWPTTNFVRWVLRELNSGRTAWFAATPSVTTLLPSKNGV